MITNAELAQALRDAGYLSDADLDAAANFLEDALIVEEAEDIEIAAMIDKAEQKAALLDAEALADAAVAVGDRARPKRWPRPRSTTPSMPWLRTRPSSTTAEAVIDAAYVDAAAALVTAELIDEANAEVVAALIAEAWAEEAEESARAGSLWLDL